MIGNTLYGLLVVTIMAIVFTVILYLIGYVMDRIFGFFDDRNPLDYIMTGLKVFVSAVSIAGILFICYTVGGSL